MPVQPVSNSLAAKISRAGLGQKLQTREVGRAKAQLD